MTGASVFLEKQPHAYPDALRRIYTQGSPEARRRRERSLSKEAAEKAEKVAETVSTTDPVKGDEATTPAGDSPRKTPAEPSIVEIPATVKRIPIFGGLFSPHDHHLSEAGIEASKRLLVATALDNPLLNYAPVLPDIGNSKALQFNYFFD
mgnify:CR=1 FL=1